jgi:hypothetical protein
VLLTVLKKIKIKEKSELEIMAKQIAVEKIMKAMVCRKRDTCNREGIPYFS